MDILKKIGKAIAFPFKHNKAFVITACALLAFYYNRKPCNYPGRAYQQYVQHAVRRRTQGA